MRKFKYYISLLVTVLILIGQPLFSQNFSFEPAETELSGELNSEVIFEITVKNLSTEELSISLLRTENDLPEGWTSSLCFDFCFAPFVDSISTTPTFSSEPLQPGETREMSVHVFPTQTEGTGTVTIMAKDDNSGEHYIADFVTTSPVTTLHVSNNTLDDYELGQNYPNPFNPSTVIEYSVPVSGYVTIHLFDVLGREVAKLVEANHYPGHYTISFNASYLPSGIYFYEMKTNSFSSIKKMILEK